LTDVELDLLQVNNAHRLLLACPASKVDAQHWWQHDGRWAVVIVALDTNLLPIPSRIDFPLHRLSAKDQQLGSGQSL
jgi:hypothetical protein